MLLLWGRTLRATGPGHFTTVELSSQRCNYANQSCNFFTEFFTSEVSVWVLTMMKIVGVANSKTLSAMSASLLRSMEAPVEARTIRMLGSRRCRKSSWRKVLASADALNFPSRSYMHWSSCVGLQSSSSSSLMSCCSLHCSEPALLLINSALRVSKEFTAGGLSRRSWTSMVNSELKELIT